MKIAFVPRELDAAECRVALTPEGVARLRQLGFGVLVESGLGLRSSFTDLDYIGAGAELVTDLQGATSRADVVFRVRRPHTREASMHKPGAVLLTLVNEGTEGGLVQALASAKVSTIALELVPPHPQSRTFDVLACQAALAGYFGVVKAAERLNKTLPLLMTPAGDLPPSRFLIVGGRWTGLQAAAIARRFGAVVEATDIYPEAEREFHSVGAAFVRLDISEAAGLAGADLSANQLRIARERLAPLLGRADAVLVCAATPGKRAPVLITQDMLTAMRPGTLVVDMGMESGGNVEGSKADQEVTNRQDVRLLGLPHPENRVPSDASELFSRCVVGFVEKYWNREEGRFTLETGDPVLKHCLLTHEGRARG